MLEIVKLFGLDLGQSHLILEDIKRRKGLGVELANAFEDQKWDLADELLQQGAYLNRPLPKLMPTPNCRSQLLN